MRPLTQFSWEWIWCILRTICDTKNRPGAYSRRKRVALQSLPPAEEEPDVTLEGNRVR